MDKQKRDFLGCLHLLIEDDQHNFGAALDFAMDRIEPLLNQGTEDSLNEKATAAYDAIEMLASMFNGRFREHWEEQFREQIKDDIWLEQRE